MTRHIRPSLPGRGRVALAVFLLTGAALGAAALALVAGSASHRDEHESRLHVNSAAASGTGRHAAGQARAVPKSRETAQELAPAVLDEGAADSFQELAAHLPGRVELALEPIGEGSSVSLGGDTPAHGWSTTKVPVLAALLQARHGDLTPDERSWAQAAITESSNEGVLRLFHDLEEADGGLIPASEYMQGLLRRSGDEETVIATAPPPPGAVTSFGQTEWSPVNAVKFFRALARGCLLSSRETGYVLSLMQRVEPSQSWGLGSAGFHSVAFKGGWGPEPAGAYLVRQSGVVDVGTSRAVAVALLAFPPPGAESFQTGTQMLTQIATWLSERLNLVPRQRVGCG